MKGDKLYVIVSSLEIADTWHYFVWGGREWHKVHSKGWSVKRIRVWSKVYTTAGYARLALRRMRSAQYAHMESITMSATSAELDKLVDSEGNLNLSLFPGGDK